MRNYIVTGIASVIVSLAVFVLGFQEKATPLPPAGSVVSSDSLTSPTCVDGVCKFTSREAFAPATTTPCGLRSPASTSTLIRVTVQSVTASTTALTFRLATSTAQNATTSSFASLAVAAGYADMVVIATSTDNLYKPNTYLNFGIEGTGFNPTLAGVCTAEWLRLQ